MLLLGCSTTLTEKPEFSHLAHQCFSLVAPTILFQSRCVNNISGQYMLTQQGKSFGDCLKEEMGIVRQGTKMEVVEIIDQFLGETGSCWRVGVKIKEGNYKDFVADIPACFIGHPQPVWVKPRFPGGHEKLQIKSEYAIEVACQ